MRGKKVAFAVIVCMLMAGGALIHYVPDMASVTGADQQAQTNLTESPGTTIK
jgi:hypothetical protein